MVTMVACGIPNWSSQFATRTFDPFYAWLEPFGTMAMLIEWWSKWSRLVPFLWPSPRDKSNWLVRFQSAKKVKSNCMTIDDTCSYATSCIFHAVQFSQEPFYIMLSCRPYVFVSPAMTLNSTLAVVVGAWHFQGAWTGHRHTRSLETGCGKLLQHPDFQKSWIIVKDGVNIVRFNLLTLISC